MGLKWFFIGVDIDRIDKMAPRGVKTAPGAIELNRHFGTKTDLLNLQCICYIFIHKISFSVNIRKNSMAQFTPEEMVKAILEEPRARTLMEKLICETVSLKVSSTYIRNFVSHT